MHKLNNKPINIVRKIIILNSGTNPTIIFDNMSTAFKLITGFAFISLS